MPQTRHGRHRPSEGRPGRGGDDRRPRPRPGRGRRRHPRVRRLPHRPALPRGRHQRRLPVPARPRGRRRRRGGRAPASPTSPPATSSSSTGARCAATAAPAARARPWYCFDTHNATQKMTLTDGTELTPALGIGAFVDKTLVAAGQCTKVDPDADPAAVGLLGCGVMAGIGAAINTGDVGPRRLGRRHRLRRCGQRRDRRCPARPARRRSSPSTSTTGSSHWRQGIRRHAHRQLDPAATRSRRPRSPAASAPTWSSTPSGRPQTYKQAFYARDLAGTVVLVGVPTPDMTLELPLIDVFGRGGALKSSAGTATACRRATSPC